MLIPDAPAVADMAESLPTVPESTYNIRVHKSQYVSKPKSAEAKGPYIKVQWVVAGPDRLALADPNDPSKLIDSPNKFIGRMIFQNYSLTGDGSFRLRELLTVTGHPDDFKLTDDSQLLGLECAALVIEKEDPGYAKKNEVRKHLPLIGFEAPVGAAAATAP